jgi:3,4-dehydroadipyl-CoA semialdehyde dehydrogenase
VEAATHNSEVANNMTRLLKSYVCGAWHEGDGRRSQLFNPTTEEVIGEACTEGLDFGAALEYARNVGGPALRKMSFAERGKMLSAMASAIHEYRNELLDLATESCGNTRGDAKFDIDGATGTLAAYAKMAEGLGDAKFLLDGENIRISRSPRYVGRHVMMSRKGVAIHINAFNFPAWGFAEKAAVALLAGMPVISKPATATALLTERIVEILVEAKVMPDGVFSFIAGSPGDMLDHVTGQDVVAFTGSAATGQMIRGGEAVIKNSVRVNVEADSLNAAVLGPDVKVESPTWDLFMRDVTTDMTQKVGQKCTAIRRIFVPADKLDAVREEMAETLSSTKVGNPTLRAVRVGPLASKAQLDDVQDGIRKLSEVAEIVSGEIGSGELTDLPQGKGYFQQPVLLQANDPEKAGIVHQHEVFGPVATLMPYNGEAAEAARLVCLGQGGLVASVYTDKRDFAGDCLVEMAPFNGRLTFGSKKVAEHAYGPGMVLPQLVHGGPGRAGAGEELGGLRGMSLYMQRTAIQGDEPMLARMFEEGTTAE